MMRTLAVLLGLVGAAASATAAPVTFNINFTSVFSNPMTGSFVYDATTKTFSAFTVYFAGDIITLTTTANNPTIAAPCSTQVVKTTPTDVQDYFSYLAGNAPNGCGNRAWIAFGLPGTLPPAYRFRLGNLDAFASAEHSATSGQISGLIDSGSFTITAATSPSSVPEPSSSALLVAGVALLSCRRKRRAAALNSRSSVHCR